jgi:HlyD family secretion protein
MRRRIKRIRWPALVVAGVLVAGSSTAYAVTNDEPAGSYRTVRATAGDVEQVLSTSGTIDAAQRADLEFGTSGTVARVKVALGDTVKAGQVIATLDKEALEAAVTKAKANLARAIAQLVSDENAQADTVADASSTSPSSDQPKGTAATPSASLTTGSEPETDAATNAALTALKEQQQAVIEAQSAATAALAAAENALAAQNDACKDAYDEQPTGASEPGDDTTDDAAENAAADNAACSAALAEVQARQDDVSDAQDALAKALSHLATTLSNALSAISSQSGGSDTPSASSTPSSSGDSPSKGSQTPSADSESPTSDGSDVQSGSSSAAKLAADQAAIEQARAELVAARQQLSRAVLRSTRSGTVRSLALAKGDEVSAGDVVAVVVGGRAVTVKAMVAESKIGQVKVGQPVRVSTPGESGTADGTVTAIGLVADSSSGTASYAVTVTVEDPTIALPSGSQALLEIVVATVADVVTVPLSAITRRGDRSFVQTWNGTTVSSRAVTVGTVGVREVEVTDGLSAGDEVVIADIDEDVTGASDTINDRGGFNRAPVFRTGPGGAGGGPPVTFKSGG